METTIIRPDTINQPLSDQEIAEAIQRQFRMQKGVNAQLIDLKTENGIVTISGYTDHLLSQERAAQIAKMVRGVRGVVNEILIHTSDVPDFVLQHNVEQALLSDPATADLGIQCTVSNGVAQVRGNVQSWPEKELILKVVKGVKGVRQINDAVETQITFRVEHNDTDMEAQIQERLQWDIRVNSALIDVQVNKSEVTLKGVVGSAAEKKQAIATAWMAGATWVNSDDLHVEHWARNEDLRQDKYDRKTDDEIRKAVRDTFLADPRVLVFQPMIEVDNGTVTLTGTVSNLRAKRAAEQDARNVVGVWSVNNALVVRPYQAPTDSQMEENVKAALARCAYLSHFGIDVHVRYGKVALYGTVDNYFELQQVEEMASGITGVVEVRNRVQVREKRAVLMIDYVFPAQTDPATNADTDQQIEKALREQLFWFPFIDESQIEVSVNQGCARIAGQVDNWQELRYLTLAAYECGATSVDNQVRVKNSQEAESLLHCKR
jgi:osmotically-inducible protein OsmY